MAGGVVVLWVAVWGANLGGGDVEAGCSTKFYRLIPFVRDAIADDSVTVWAPGGDPATVCRHPRVVQQTISWQIWLLTHGWFRGGFIAELPSVTNGSEFEAAVRLIEAGLPPAAVWHPAVVHRDEGPPVPAIAVAGVRAEERDALMRATGSATWIEARLKAPPDEHGALAPTPMLIEHTADGTDTIHLAAAVSGERDLPPWLRQRDREARLTTRRLEAARRAAAAAAEASAPPPSGEQAHHETPPAGSSGVAFYEQIDDVWFFATEKSCEHLDQLLAVLLQPHLVRTWKDLAARLDAAPPDIRREIVDQFGIDLDEPWDDEDVEGIISNWNDASMCDRECWPGSLRNLEDAGVPLEVFEHGTVGLSAPGMGGEMNGIWLDENQLRDVLARLEDLGFTCTRTQGTIRSLVD